MRTMATFRLWGTSGGTAAHVTQQLGLLPDSAAEAGDAVGRRTPRVRDESLWCVSSCPGPEDDTELASQLHRVLDRLEPVAPGLWALVEAGYEANWFCFVGSDAPEHAVELDRATLQRVLGLPGDVWLDVYPDADDA